MFDDEVVSFNFLFTYLKTLKALSQTVWEAEEIKLKMRVIWVPQDDSYAVLIRLRIKQASLVK